jgi:hypothetical protein
MAFIIEYYKEGVLKGKTPWGDTLERTKQVALEGLSRHDADFARIINDETGAEVDSVRRDADATRT